ncbi:bifunctional helix-turn-helix domain-containing protein/methylated-DNA--[protein]-cysteine S-methyltransferase [Leptospira limi]|uniref:Bifunctional helix-turn-helix domain-containing protein/methylated-DNA--[protein]-cysteine S-methyltransferase n=1 Tax=Leptospira limi TaxID=2950023 RepID=A0ABT3M1W9_9LEPT|nr:bifunctional helix-turn-helix domain-containing protein/methylated-DNA--[protein]-cysteine S-methyltransferase [Leptospira limi]MCW7463969.1 bifunctional helix-turn-helix domain-containing protein/methylated-DNA--[protein]-cysteine S-methyltransferase [Leptospira limi]
MESQRKHYQLIQNVIEYLIQNFESHPSLDSLAQIAKLSPSHFQKLFLEYVGVSPKQFLSSITLTHAKRIIQKTSILDTTYRLGLSGTGRLHDLFIKLEGMTPGEFKSFGEGVHLYYEFFPTILGEMVVVSSEKSIQSLQFLQRGMDKEESLSAIKVSFPNAIWKGETRELHNPVKEFLQTFTVPKSPIHLSVLGTPFQIKVWQSLLSIPSGDTSTYGEIAESIGQKNAHRAVGTAIGKNPIAVLIPCHRVIQSSGLFGGYRWDPKRKQTLLMWEKATYSHKMDTEHSI